MRETFSAFGMAVPEDTLASLNRYISDGIPTGGFLEAVISNDLHSAVARADDTHIRCLPAIVSYLYNEAPAGCWGRPESFRKWIEHKREVR